MAQRPATTPENGARFILDRRSVDGGAAEYSALVLDPEGRELAFDVHLATDGEVRVVAQADDVPEWIGRHVEGLARQIRTSGQREGIWPRRVRRWRASNE